MVPQEASLYSFVANNLHVFLIKKSRLVTVFSPQAYNLFY